MPHETRRIPLSTPFGRQVGSRFSMRGPFLSAVAHVAVVLLLLYGAQKSAEALAAGNGPGKGGGGGGGGNRQFTVVMQEPAASAPRPPVVQPKPVETPQLVVPRVVKPLDSIVPPSASPVTSTQAATGPGSGTGAGPGSGTGTGGGTGSGTGTGTGSGIGPDSGGAGGNVYPPQPIGILMPPEGKPGSVRGVTYKVRFDISERGDVLGVETDPEIRDRGYRNSFLDKMRHYTFTPATTRQGQRVRATFEIRITL